MGNAKSKKKNTAKASKKSARKRESTEQLGQAATDLAQEKKKQEVPSRYDECAICYDALCVSKVGVLANRIPPKRFCRHYFHLHCLEYFLSLEEMNQKCPYCKAGPADCVELPNPWENADLWFNLVGNAFANNDKVDTIEPAELMQALCAQFDISRSQSQKVVNDKEIWKKFDPDGSGNISRGEFDKKEGVLDFLLETFPECSGKKWEDDDEETIQKIRARRSGSPPPDIRSNPKGWFSHWDTDKSGALTQQEVLRAILKTIGAPSRNHERIIEVRKTVLEGWAKFDTNNSGSIDLAEFAKDEGLGETLILALFPKQ